MFSSGKKVNTLGRYCQLSPDHGVRVCTLGIDRTFIVLNVVLNTVMRSFLSFHD